MYVTGDAMQWHKLTLNFEGPTLSEAPETFMDHRLDVVFTHESGATIKVPGYFAADGDAANSNATSGNIWQVNFNAPLEGDWTWEASFRTGDEIAVKTTAGQSAGFFDGDNGSISIAETDKTGDDLRAKGVLEYDGGQYLSFQGTGETFLKSGVGSPENLLAYSGFDDTPDSHDYTPHLDDYNSGDPTWDGGKGKEIIGAVNYLAEHDVNSAYMMLMNIGGDGRDVSPWADTSLYDIEKDPGFIDLNERAQVFDVSKLDQWEIVFGHMQENGINLHLFLQETENDQLLNNGDLGPERMLFMREMVARFGHHNGVIWNLGEENSNSTAQIRDHSEYLKSLDPYGHAVTMHTLPGQQSKFESYEGSETLDALSFQTSGDTQVPDLDRYLGGAEDAGRKVVAFLDEPGSASVGMAAEGDSGWETNHDNLRETLWKFYAEGGSGAEWYYGYNTQSKQGGDLLMEDFSVRESAYQWAASAREFFEKLPLEEMRDGDDLTSSAETHGLALDGAVYAYYLPDGGSPDLDLNGQDGTYQIGWYDVINGGDLITGSVETISGGGVRSLGEAPSDQNGEWAVVVWNPERFDFDVSGEVTPPPPDNPDPDPVPDPDPTPDPDPIPDPDPVIEALWAAEDGKIVMQAEKGVPTDSDDPGNNDWTFTDELGGHTGEGYLRWDGPDLFSQPGSGALTYKFEVTEGGEYKLGLLGSRPENGLANHQNNDFFVRMDGGEWTKVYFNGDRETWNWGDTFYVGGKNLPAQFDLEPGEHVFEISGRSFDTYLDKIHLSLGTLDEDISAPETLIEMQAPPDTPTSDGPTVTVLLVDVASGEVINTLAPGDTLGPEFIGDDSFTIVADVEGSVGSVQFTLGDIKVVENGQPYALFGDSKGSYRPPEAPIFENEGDYELKVELFSARNAQGDKLGETVTSFSLGEVATPPPPPDPPEDPDTPVVDDPAPPSESDGPTSVILVDSLTDMTLLEMSENTVLHQSVLDGRALSIASEVDEAELDAESARLWVDDSYSQVENFEPYALFGDLKGDYRGSLELEPDATRTVGIEYYSENGAGGDLIYEDQFDLVVDGDNTLSARSDEVDIFGIDASAMGDVLIEGFASGDSVADVGSGLIDLLSQGSKVGDDWVIDFGEGNRLTLADYDAEDDPLLF